MKKFLSTCRSILTLTFLWSFIGVSAYTIFSTFTANADVAPTATNDDFRIEPPIENSDRPYGFPEIDEFHLAASASEFAHLPGATDLTFDGEGNGYILTESGMIFRCKPSGKLDTIPYLSLSRETTALNIGFSAIALHPGFLDPESRGYGRFYVIEPEIANSAEADFVPTHGNHTEHHQDVLVEYRTTDTTARIFSGGRREVLRLSQPGRDHNMGSLAFDRSGRLFIAIGDGAAGKTGKHTPSRNAMELDNVFGKILRIDPLGSNSANTQYGIPRRNPFRFLDETLPEIYSYGLRSPYHIEFDIFRQQLCITDLGMDGIDEVNLAQTGGEHFGWDLCEGSFFYPPARQERTDSGVTQPIVEFATIETGSLAGSVFYYGHRFPELNQKLIVASQNGEIFATRPGENPTRILLDNGPALTRGGIKTIRSGTGGELLVVTEFGNIFEITKRATSTKSTGKTGRRMLAMSPF